MREGEEEYKSHVSSWAETALSQWEHISFTLFFFFFLLFAWLLLNLFTWEHPLILAPHENTTQQLVILWGPLGHALGDPYLISIALGFKCLAKASLGKGQNLVNPRLLSRSLLQGWASPAIGERWEKTRWCGCLWGRAGLKGQRMGDRGNE